MNVITIEPDRVPVFLNRFQLATECRVPLTRIYGAEIEPDALDLKGHPFFALARLNEIRRIVTSNVPEITV